MDWSSFSIGNAAGFIKGPGKRFDDMLRSSATEITIGSIKINPGDGNPGAPYDVDEDGTSINALGLPNPGLEKTLETAPDMYRRARDAGKQLRWSFAGSKPQEFASGYRALKQFGVVELNLGCPNVWSEGKQGPIFSYIPFLVEDILVAVEKEGGDGYDVKVSPGYPHLIEDLSRLFNRRQVRRVINCNTYPNAIVVRDGRRVLDTKNGYGGLGGKALYSIMLGTVAQYAELLAGSDTQVIGVGGIDSAETVSAARLVGASGVQIGTAYDVIGYKIFYDILEELAKPE